MFVRFNVGQLFGNRYYGKGDVAELPESDRLNRMLRDKEKEASEITEAEFTATKKLAEKPAEKTAEKPADDQGKGKKK